MRLLNSLDANELPGETNARQSAKVLQDLASALAHAAEALKTTPVGDIKRGINFYEEVQRFEVALIMRALKETDGQQGRAARLLGLKVTTLNSKIKNYNINYQYLRDAAGNGDK